MICQQVIVSGLKETLQQTYSCLLLLLLLFTTVFHACMIPGAPANFRICKTKVAAANVVGSVAYKATIRLLVDRLLKITTVGLNKIYFSIIKSCIISYIIYHTISYYIISYQYTLQQLIFIYYVAFRRAVANNSVADWGRGRLCLLDAPRVQPAATSKIVKRF